MIAQDCQQNYCNFYVSLVSLRLQIIKVRTENPIALKCLPSFGVKGVVL